MSHKPSAGDPNASRILGVWLAALILVALGAVALGHWTAIA